jgi:NADH-quinone oxidoreductase subunit E
MIVSSVTEQDIEKRLLPIVTPYQGEKGALIPVLQKVQEEFGYLPREVIPEIARILCLSESEIYGVATFFAQFRFERQGEHTVKCCQGTACYVQGGKRILDAVRKELDLPEGKTTTDDYKFRSCALAPVMVIDKTVYGRMTPIKAREILARYY